MSAPVLRIGKVKRMGRVTPESVMGHNARRHPVPNVASRRTPMNEWLVGGPEQDLRADINGVIIRAGMDPAALRKDATIANDMVLSISPEWFRPGRPAERGTWEEDRLAIFRREAMAMLKPYGARVVSAVLHLDESTPHIQAVIVPVMKTREGTAWRLSGKDMFDPAALRTLQQGWEDRLQPHGVGIRIKGSTARHNPVNRYYAALGTFGDADPVPTLTVPDPPIRGRLEADSAYGERVEGWKDVEGKKLRRKLKPLSVEASKGRLYEAERRTADQLRGIVKERTADLVATRIDLMAASAAVEVSKEEAARLRGIPIHAVAAALGHTDSIGPRENAIDLVKRVGEMDYKQAVTWLAQQFGADAAAAATAAAMLPKAVAAERAPAEFTKADRVKRTLVAQQLDALAAPEYRITLMKVDEETGRKVAQNLGKSHVDGEPERRWSRDDVLTLIPELSVANHAGRNVFITPLDPHAHHIVVDDVDGDGLRDLAARGFTPALTIETSPFNHQAVLKVPVGNDTPEDAARQVFNDLNRDIGDERITGLIHAVRLAGFENRKEKHRDHEGRFPFVSIGHAVNRFCRKATALVREYAMTAWDAERSPAERAARRPPLGPRQ